MRLLIKEIFLTGHIDDPEHKVIGAVIYDLNDPPWRKHPRNIVSTSVAYPNPYTSANYPGVYDRWGNVQDWDKWRKLND